MNCGLNATIIAYRNAHDIDVQFEDGMIREHRLLNSFKKSTIAHTPIDHKNDSIGQTRTMNCGMKATIIAYRRSDDIDVQFENGIIREHKSMKQFETGQIAPTQFGIKTYHIGKTNIMSCGMKATVIAYRGCNDIDVQFEDGIIREHMTIACFKTGQIAHTTFRLKTHHIGQTRVMNCGMKATVIAYRGCNDIDVQFENGTVREHMKIACFKTGQIAPSTINARNKYIGETLIMNCGIKATIIEYRTNRDIDIKFEDGTIREHRTVNDFYNGKIAHPNNNILFDTYKLDKVAFQFHDKTYFYVTYTKNDSEISEVMCIDDMKNKLPELAK